MTERRECSIWMHRMDISRSTIDRERWQIKKRKISEKQNIKKKGCDQARGLNRVNIGATFQQWRDLKNSNEHGLETDVRVVLLLLDSWVTLILLRFTQLILFGFCLNMLVCHLHLFRNRRLCTYVWGWYFKIRARSCWGMGVFVLVF